MDERHEWFITEATHVLGHALWEYREGKWERYPGPVILLVEKLYPLKDRGDERRTAWWDTPTSSAVQPDGTWVDSRVRQAVQLTDGTFWPEIGDAALTTIIPQGEHPTDEDD